MTYLYWEPQYFAKSWESLARQVLPPDVYASRGVKGLYMMDTNLLIDLDNLRKNLGVPLVVNNSKGRSQSGLRTVDFYESVTAYFASYSDHKVGKALDFVSPSLSAQEIRKHILENTHLYPAISFLEVGYIESRDSDNNKVLKIMDWVHISSRLRLENKDIRCWSPANGFISKRRVIEEGL